MRRSDQDAGAANERHEPADLLGTEPQPGVEEYLFVFREDRLGNVKLDLAVQLVSRIRPIIWIGAWWTEVSVRGGPWPQCD
jgi:hypothetical protein